MLTTTYYPHSLVQDWRREFSTKEKLFFGLVFIAIGWLMLSVLLQLIDPAIGVLDFGILTVAVFGLLVSWATVFISVWLQELLWKPFKYFRKEFQSHFNQLTSWQQCILYFLVFFLVLFAVLKGMEVVL